MTTTATVNYALDNKQFKLKKWLGKQSEKINYEWKQTNIHCCWPE